MKFIIITQAPWAMSLNILLSYRVCADGFFIQICRLRYAHHSLHFPSSLLSFSLSPDPFIRFCVYWCRDGHSECLRWMAVYSLIIENKNEKRPNGPGKCHHSAVSCKEIKFTFFYDIMIQCLIIIIIIISFR